MEKLKSNKIRKIKDKNKISFSGIIATAIGNTIRYSLDDEYREKCFKLLKVSNTYDCQESIRRHFTWLMDPTNSSDLSINTEGFKEYLTSEKSLRYNENESNYAEKETSISNSDGRLLKNVDGKKGDAFKKLNNLSQTSKAWQLTSSCLWEENNTDKFI